MIDPESAKKYTLLVGRIVFVLTALAFGMWSISRNWSAVASALQEIDFVRIGMALALVLVGLTLAAGSFSVLLSDVGYPRPIKVGLTIFFLGSLGKYIPGSIWFLAAQADLARRAGVPPRKAITVGLLVVYWALLSATTLGALAVGLSTGLPRIPQWIMFVGAVLAAVGLAPRVVNWWARRLSGERHLPPPSIRTTWNLALLFAGVWILNGLAIAVLVGGADSGGFAALFVIGLGAFALSFALGLIMPLAPAGLGLREGALVLLLIPSVGVGMAVVAATTMRLIHLIGDFGCAGAAWLFGRGSLVAASMADDPLAPGHSAHE